MFICMPAYMYIRHRYACVCVCVCVRMSYIMKGVGDCVAVRGEAKPKCEHIARCVWCLLDTHKNMYQVSSRIKNELLRDHITYCSHLENVIPSSFVYFGNFCMR